MPSASSRAEVAKRTSAFAGTTATSVASRSSDGKRAALSGCSLRALDRGAGARQFPLDPGDVVLIAGDACLELGDAVEVLLLVAVLGAEVLRLAVVVFLGQLVAARFGLLQFLLEDRARIRVALFLFGRIDSRVRCRRDLRRRRTVHAGALHHGDVAAVHELAALGPGFG